MRPYSEKEQSIIRSLLEADQEVFTLVDFIRSSWPVGHFEISTFQQVVRVHLEKEEHLGTVMGHLLEVLALIRYLEYKGYLSSWDAFPMQDNTEKSGPKSNDQKPYFLPDLSVVSDLLRFGNKKFTLSNGLKTLVKRNFKSVASRRHGQLMRTLIAGFLVLSVIGLTDIYTNYRMIESGIKVNLAELQSKNTEVLENQKLNQVIIDSLHWQSKQLIIMANQIGRNTANTKAIENEVKRQNIRINQLRSRNLRLYELSSENHQLLKKTDSLLNKIALN